jgi:peptidoglycan/xylan/chitin deacetylase (PgdA/CDA1 family)
MNSGEFHWPDGKRIAVAFTVMMETWSDGKCAPYSVQATPLKPGTPDLAGIAWCSYGGKVGVWRISNMLAENGMKGTFCVNARCTELYPDAVKQIVAAGHEVAGHGYVQDELMIYQSPEQEQSTIKRCLQLLEQTTGVRPKGWLSPVMAFSEHTRRLLAEEKLSWHGDARDVDLPRLVDTDAGQIVHIPGSDFTDNRVLRSSTMDLWEIYKETFDYLYLREKSSFLAMSMHCHFGGRPMVTAVMDKLLKYMKQHPDVWFASYSEIAAWIKQNNFAPETYARRLLTM